MEIHTEDNSVFNFKLIAFCFVSTASNEFCQSELFRAHCSEPDQVILMESAWYGRMKIGRCVEDDLGYIGCKVNVLHR